MGHQIPPRRDTLRQRQPRVTSDKHSRWIATLPCLVTGIEQRTQTAHVSYRDHEAGKPGRGLGGRESDRWTVPLSIEEHDAQHAHKRGERAYWEERGIDPLAVAKALWECTGDTEAALVILATARRL